MTAEHAASESYRPWATEVCNRLLTTSSIRIRWVFGPCCGPGARCLWPRELAMRGAEAAERLRLRPLLASVLAPPTYAGLRYRSALSSATRARSLAAENAPPETCGSRPTYLAPVARSIFLRIRLMNHSP